MGKHFLWDPVEDNIVKEIDDSGTTIADYTTEPYLYGDLISQHRDGQASFYHYDGQGSTTSLTDSASNVTDTYAYSAFGEVNQHAGTSHNPFTFIGKAGYYLACERLAYHVRQRELLTQHARWLSTDPLHNRDTRNWLYAVSDYVYVRNGPLAMVDPSGNIPHDDPALPKPLPDTGVPCDKGVRLGQRSALVIKAKATYTLTNKFTVPCFVYCFPFYRYKDILWPGEYECEQTIKLEASDPHTVFVICAPRPRKQVPTWRIYEIEKRDSKVTAVETKCGDCEPILDGPYV